MGSRTAKLASAFDVLLAAALLVALPGASAAQADDARCTVDGSVTSTSVPVPGVSIAIRQSASNRLVESTSTNGRGHWRAQLPPDTYTIRFELYGFETQERSLELRGLATACLLTREDRLVIAAPIATSSPLFPSSTTTDAPERLTLTGRALAVNRAALRERARALARGEFSLDDGTAPRAERAGDAATVTNTAAESTIATRNSGALNLAAPAAAAQRAPARIGAARLYSATASYTMAASALDAAPYQLRPGATPVKPEYLRQSVDFTVGGPLAFAGMPSVLSRTNTTLSYAAIRGGNLFDQYATVPTLAMRAGDLSSSSGTVRDPLTGLPFADGIIPADRISPVAEALLAYLPLPNGPGTSRNAHLTSTSRSTQDTFNLRITHPLAGTDSSSPRDARRARSTEPGRALSATLNGQVEYRRNVNDRLSAMSSIAGVGATSVLRTPFSLNVTRRGSQHSLSVNYTRNRTRSTNLYTGVTDVARAAGIAGASTDPFDWGLPVLSFATLTTLNDLTPNDRTDRRFSAAYAWSRGVRAHRLRLGVDAGDIHSTSRTDQNARGTFVFTGAYSGSDFGDFLLGLPQQTSVQYGPGVVHLAGRSLSLFAQDDWRRWSNVSINAGLRYELVTPFHDTAGKLVNLDAASDFTAVSPIVAGGHGPYTGTFPEALIRTDRNNIAPRIGIAWQLAPRTTLRAGYGVGFNTGAYASMARQLAAQPPFATTNTATGSLTEPLSLTSLLTTTQASTSNTYGVARDYDAGVVRTWTLDVSRDLGDAWNVSANLTRTSGSHLDIVRAPNRGPSGLRLPDVQPFLWQTSEGRSRLRAITFRVRRWYVRGMSLSANYRLATAMDNASTIGGGATVVAQDEQNLAAEWGRSSFDRRHQLSGDWNFELPFGGNHRWLNRGPLAMVFGAWSAYVTFSAQTGTPLTPRVLGSATDVARGINGTLRADLTGEPIAVGQPTVDRFFNTAAFAVPQPGTFGSAGRNVITGPGSRDLSLQMTRDLPAGGTRALSVQIRISNLLNLVNYAAVDTVVNSPTFGQVLSVRPLRSTQLNVRWKF